jgi:hypothetical protein
MAFKAFATALSVAFASESIRSQCSEWAAGFEEPATLDPGPYAAHVHDDGSGPALYISCDEATIAGVELNGIARWDGVAFTALGTGLSSPALAMATFDHGGGTALYVGGYFLSAGGVSVPGFARWDGSTWSPVAALTGSGEHAHSLLVWDDGSGPALYVSGFFDSVDGVPVSNIARWDGTTWSDLGGGLGNGDAYELMAFGGALYAAGDFDTAGGTTAKGFARWNGVAWSPMDGTPTPQEGFSLGQWDFGSGPVLVAGGLFGGVANPVERTATWDGSDWTPLGATGLGAKDIEIFDDGNGPALYIAEGCGPYRWNGQAWVGLGLDCSCSSGPSELQVFDEGSAPSLFALGHISQIDPVKPGRDLTRWDGATWSAVLPGGLGLDEVDYCSGFGNTVPAVYEFHAADLGTGTRLYAGGNFINAGGLGSASFAAWDGTSWSALGGVSGTVHAIQAWDDGAGTNLFVGGAFNGAGGVGLLNFARFDGASFADIGRPNGAVNALAVFDGGTEEQLYAGGEFTKVDGVSMKRIARWNGSAWSALPGGDLNALAAALAVFDDGNGPRLFAGGAFTTAGATVVSRIARYDGTSWFDVGGGVAGGKVQVLLVHDDGSGPALFVGGEFTSVGTTGAKYVARWDGTAWSSLAGGNPNGPVRALAVHDEGDGRGPGLYVGGSFTTAGGVAASNLARWDTSGWSALSSGTGDEVVTLSSFAGSSGGWPALYAGGPFDTAGGMPSSGIARWSNSCPCQGTSYCTAGTTTSGCQALISSTGSASLSTASGFDVSVASVEGDKLGLLYFGTSGAKATPWGMGTSWFCVKGPHQRTPVQSSGGTSGLCNGVFALDFNTWMAANPASAPAAGGQVWMQAWFRDPPAPKTTSLSDALTFSVCP